MAFSSTLHLNQSFSSTDMKLEKSLKYDVSVNILKTEFTISKALSGFQIDISMFEVEEALEGKHFFKGVSTDKVKDAGDMMSKIIDARAKSKGLSLKKETTQKLANFLLLILRKTEDSL